jgi:hypothetical protein
LFLSPLAAAFVFARKTNTSMLLKLYFLKKNKTSLVVLAVARLFKHDDDECYAYGH